MTLSRRKSFHAMNVTLRGLLTVTQTALLNIEVARGRLLVIESEAVEEWDPVEKTWTSTLPTCSIDEYKQRTFELNSGVEDLTRLRSALHGELRSFLESRDIWDQE